MNSQAPIRVEPAESKPTPTALEDELQFAGLCGRPSCRKQIQQSIGPGRKRAYCSDICRRGADKDYKQAQALVAHLSRLLERSRYDVAAFGRDDEDDDRVRTPAAEAQIVARANGAVQRAEGVLEFADGDERLLRELRNLVSAVNPLLPTVTQ